MRSKILWIKDEYLNQILDGRKTIEVRVAYSNLINLEPGDILRLNDQYTYKIQHIAKYPDFEELLQNENPVDIAPDLQANELLQTLRQIYPPEKEMLGVLAIKITATE